MNDNLVITIGRRCGSGGKAIGEIIAKELGIKCYDKELLDLAAKNSGLAQELFETYDERPTSSFLYSLVMDTYSVGYSTSGYRDMPINHKIFLAQFDAIRKLADDESCVIVGRCADYALEGYPMTTRVFITADDESRIQHLMNVHDINHAKAKDIMVKTDKQRTSYYNYYASKTWGEPENYDLCLNSNTLGYEGTAKIIIDFAKAKAERIRAAEKTAAE